jgi:hypothetical protein
MLTLRVVKRFDYLVGETSIIYLLNQWVVLQITILEGPLRFIAFIDSGLLHHGFKCVQVYTSVVSAILEFWENPSGLADCARDLSWLRLQKNGLC